MSKSPWEPPLPTLHIIAWKETSEGGEEGREYQLSFQPSALDCQRLRECTHGQATLPKSISILHLLLRDLSHPQIFRFPWQAYNRSMFYLTLDVPWYWLGGWVGCCRERGGSSYFKISAPRLQEWTEKAKAIPQPGGLSSLLESQVVSFLWKQEFGTEASEAAIIPKGCQRVLESLLWGSSDLMKIQTCLFHPCRCSLSALHTCPFPGLRGHGHHLHGNINFNQKSGRKAQL